MIKQAIGCTEATPWPAEFWVQSAKWGQPACAQHVAGVMRKALRDDRARAVVVDSYPPPERECRVAGDPSIPPAPIPE